MHGLKSMLFVLYWRWNWKIHVKSFCQSPSKIVLPKCPTIFLHPISATEMSPQLFLYDPILSPKCFLLRVSPYLESFKPGPSNFWPCLVGRYFEKPAKICHKVHNCPADHVLKETLKLRCYPKLAGGVDNCVPKKFPKKRRSHLFSSLLLLTSKALSATLLPTK